METPVSMVVYFPTSLKLKGKATRIVAAEMLPSTSGDPSPIMILVGGAGHPKT